MKDFTETDTFKRLRRESTIEKTLKKYLQLTDDSWSLIGGGFIIEDKDIDTVIDFLHTLGFYEPMQDFSGNIEEFKPNKHYHVTKMQDNHDNPVYMIKLTPYIIDKIEMFFKIQGLITGDN